MINCTPIICKKFYILSRELFLFLRDPMYLRLCSLLVSSVLPCVGIPITVTSSSFLKLKSLDSQTQFMSMIPSSTPGPENTLTLNLYYEEVFEIGTLTLNLYNGEVFEMDTFWVSFFTDVVFLNCFFEQTGLDPRPIGYFYVFT